MFTAISTITKPLSGGFWSPGDVIQNGELNADQIQHLLAAGAILEGGAAVPAKGSNSGPVQVADTSELRQLRADSAELPSVKAALVAAQELLSLLTPEESAELESRAQAAKEQAEKAAEGGTAEPPAGDGLEELTAAELRDRAKELGIEKIPAKKADVIKAIREKAAEGG